MVQVSCDDLHDSQGWPVAMPTHYSRDINFRRSEVDVGESESFTLIFRRRHLMQAWEARGLLLPL